MIIAILTGLVIIAVLTILSRQFFKKSLDLYEENELPPESEFSENKTETEFPNTEIRLNSSAILKPKEESISKYPYNLQETLLSPAESEFFQTLQETFKDEYEIFAKVRAVDVLYVDVEKRNFYVYFNRIARNHFDFIICSKQYAIVAAVEFDDPKNQANAKTAQGIRMDEICKIASLPLIKFDANDHYSVEDIRSKLNNALEQASSLY